MVAIVILNSFFNCTHCHAQIMHQIAFTSHTYIRLTLHCSKGMCVFNSSYYSSKWIFDLVQLLSILIHLLNTNYTLNMKYYLKYELQMSSFILICKYIKVLELESATLEGFCSQLRALSLQILLSYIKCSSQSHSQISSPFFIFSRIKEYSTALWHLRPNSRKPTLQSPLQ